MASKPLVDILNIELVLQIAISQARRIDKDYVLEVVLLTRRRLDREVVQQARECLLLSLFVLEFFHEGEELHAVVSFEFGRLVPVHD